MKMTKMILANLLLTLVTLHGADRSAGSVGQADPTKKSLTAAEGTGQKVENQAVSSLSVFDFKFPGGSVMDFLKQLEEQGPEKMNLILTPGFVQRAMNISVPPMDLHNVTKAAIIRAFNQILIEANAQIMSESTGGKELIYTGISRPKADQRRPQVFYVGNLLNKFKIEDITTAIQTTWEFAKPKEGENKPELKYHQDTQLILVFATPEQINVVADVLDQLNPSRHEVPPSAGLPMTNSISPDRTPKKSH